MLIYNQFLYNNHKQNQKAVSMKKIIGFINRLPFAGKTYTKECAFRLFCQSMTKKERLENWLSLMMWLTFSIFFHALTGFLGLYMLQSNAPLFAKAIFGIYALANACAVLAQMHLAWRSTLFFFTGKYPKRKKTWKDFSSEEVITMAIITMGGISIFLATYLMYG